MVSSAAASSHCSIHLPPLPQGSPGLHTSSALGSTLPRAAELAASAAAASAAAASAAAAASSATVDAVCCVPAPAPAELLPGSWSTEQEASAELCCR
jgi:hypothetical protein